MTKLVREILDKANAVLVDVTKQRWPYAELQGYLDSAQIAICARRPDASTALITHDCTQSARQVLADPALRLIKVESNSSSKLAITAIDVDVLDEQIPDWRYASTPASDVQHYTYDDRDPKAFHVYPVVSTNHQIELVASVMPPQLSEDNWISGTVEIAVDETYEPALLDYVLHRAFQKDADNPSYSARSTVHLQSFLEYVGGKTQSDASVSPNNG